jgi:hypothetical protein
LSVNQLLTLIITAKLWWAIDTKKAPEAVRIPMINTVALKSALILGHAVALTLLLIPLFGESNPWKHNSQTQSPQEKN